MNQAQSAYLPLFLDDRTKRGFIDSVYAILMAPNRTLEIMCDANRHLANKSNLVAASIAATTASAVSAIGLGQYMYFVTGLLSWFITANLLCLTCKIFGTRQIQFATAIIASAWTMLPLIFIGPLACLKTLPHSHYPVGMAMIICIGWSCALQILAFKHCLGTNLARTLAILIAAPFAIISGAIFWLALILISSADFL